MSSIRRFPRLVVATVAAMLLGLTLSTSTAVAEPSPTLEPEVPSFVDVPETHSFYEHITLIASWGLVKGFADDTFRPNSPVTRGQLAVIAYKYLGEPEFTPPEESPFSDMTPEHTFYKHVTWLAATEVVNGYEDGTFRPNGKLSRGQLASILFNLIGPGSGDGEYTAPEESPFEDVDEDFIFYPHIAWLEETGIVNGYGDGTFRPDAALTRGQTAVIIVKVDRFLNPPT